MQYAYQIIKASIEIASEVFTPELLVTETFSKIKK